MFSTKEILGLLACTFVPSLDFNRSFKSATTKKWFNFVVPILTDNPLYLIVEFAMYGSLQNFLKECEEAVLCMNHSPHVSYKTGRYQSCSDSPTFMSQSLKFSHESSSSKKTTLSHPSNPAAASAATKTCEQGDMLTCESDATVVGSSAQAVYDCISAPATHDYINSKGLLYVEDVQSFALQIASGLKHLEKEKVIIHVAQSAKKKKKKIEGTKLALVCICLDQDKISL